MTKKQVLASIRARLDHARDVAEREKFKYSEHTDFYEYFSGRIDAYDFILDCLCDYD